MTETQQTEHGLEVIPVKRLNIKEVLIKTFEVYKAGFKPLFISQLKQMLGYIN